MAAAGTLGKPGSDRGPCRQPCRHDACAEARAWAAARCHYCGTPIGYERRFYREGMGDCTTCAYAVEPLLDAGAGARPYVLVHATCAERAAERERALAAEIERALDVVDDRRRA